MMIDDPSVEFLKEHLVYDKLTGLFTWIKATSNRVKVGDVAGVKNSLGYVVIGICSKLFYAHRLAWMYEYSQMPELQIDHKDGDRSNNRLSNLRLSTQPQNMQNMARRSDNSTGYTGVSFHKPSGRWTAYIHIGGARKHIGCFESPELAANAYSEAKRVIHTFNPIQRDLNESDLRKAVDQTLAYA